MTNQLTSSQLTSSQINQYAIILCGGSGTRLWPLSRISIFEVQCGDYVGEDDIIRFDDSYGRVI